MAWTQTEFQLISVSEKWSLFSICGREKRKKAIWRHSSQLWVNFESGSGLLFHKTMLLLTALSQGRSGCDFKDAIYSFNLLIGIFRYSSDNALLIMPQNLPGDKSALVQVMAWCRQATSHYLNQRWPRSLTHICGTKRRWVNKVVGCQHKNLYAFSLVTGLL